MSQRIFLKSHTATFHCGQGRPSNTGLFRKGLFLALHRERLPLNSVCRETQQSWGRPTEIVNADVTKCRRLYQIPLEAVREVRLEKHKLM